jgi:hypothetical protein
VRTGIATSVRSEQHDPAGLEALDNGMDHLPDLGLHSLQLGSQSGALPPSTPSHQYTAI